MTFDVHGFEVEEEERPQGHDPREDSRECTHPLVSVARECVSTPSITHSLFPAQSGFGCYVAFPPYSPTHSLPSNTLSALQHTLCPPTHDLREDSSEGTHTLV